MFDPTTVNWDDARIKPYLQRLASQTFDALTLQAQYLGLPIVAPLPFTQMPEDAETAWKACIVAFLTELMGPEKKDA